MLFSNVLSFSILHLMYDNWVAPVFTLIGGYFFASNWMKNRSFSSIWIEHAVYGLAIFTFGLNQYFYEAPGG